MLEALEDELKSLWPEVDVVSRSPSGTQAIREIQTRKIDIAFLDIQMPGANGLEVVQTIIEDWPEVSDPEYYPCLFSCLSPPLQNTPLKHLN